MNFSKKNHEHRLTIERAVSKTKLTLFALLITALSFAQNGINYKAVIKDGLGNVVANQTIDVKFSIIEDVGFTILYAEDHTNVMTDANGIIILNIGEGTPTTNTFESVVWGNASHSLKTELDIEQDGTFEDLGTTQFKAVPYALNVTGLERISEGGNTGWRYKARNPDNYGRIGFNATDLSISDGASTTNGATGSYSFAIGYNSEAKGYMSSAMGLNSKSLGNYSFAIGPYSEAIGQYTTAIGYRLKTDAFLSTAFGTNNIGTGSPSSWVEEEPLFEVGNGFPDTRSNALTILKNGTITAPSLTNALIETAGTKALVTKEYVDNKITENVEHKAAIQIRPSSDISGFNNFQDLPLVFTDIKYNYGGGAYNDLTGKYFVPYDGVYNITSNFAVKFSSTSVNSMVLTSYIYVNGDRVDFIVQQHSIYTTAYPKNYNYNHILDLNQGDVINVIIKPTWGGATPAPYIEFENTSITITKVY